MKKLLIVLSCFCLCFCFMARAFAQAPADQTAATPPFTSDELDQLLGPIALYPDPLIGLILPASTVPSDIVAADQYVQQNGDPGQIANQPWDDSVKGLTHYPDLLKWLDQNLAWTTQVGTAYLAQPDDVMNSIQQLRARAKADGTLLNTDQQQVSTDDSGDISITPTNPDQICVPQYDDAAVYNDDYTLDEGPVITFGPACPVGPWLYYWPDWHHHGIFTGDWRLWRGHRGESGFVADPSARVWTPNRARVRTPYVIRTPNQASPVIVQAKPMTGTTIVHASRPPAVRPAYVAPPQTDYTGRGPVVSRPAFVPPPPAEVPRQSVVTQYGRGSDAWAASQRGAESRQSTYGGATVQSTGRSSAPVFQGTTTTGGGGNGQGRNGR